MKKYQKGGMPQGMRKSAVMPGRNSSRTPPMATPKRGSGTPSSSASSYGGMYKSAVMPGRAGGVGGVGNPKPMPMGRISSEMANRMRKSAVMPGRAGSKTPPMAQEPKRSSSGGMRKSAVMPGRGGSKTPAMAKETKRSSAGGTPQRMNKSAVMPGGTAYNPPMPARGSKTPPMAKPTRGRAGGARRSPTKRLSSKSTRRMR